MFCAILPNFAEALRPEGGGLDPAAPQAGGEELAAAEDKNRPTRIVVGIAATTAGIDSATAEVLPLVQKTPGIPAPRARTRARTRGHLPSPDPAPPRPAPPSRPGLRWRSWSRPS